MPVISVKIKRMPVISIKIERTVVISFRNRITWIKSNFKVVYFVSLIFYGNFIAVMKLESEN